MQPRPWVGAVFFVVSVFGALNLALPLVGVPPFAALLIAAWLAVVGLTPAVRRARHWRWITAVARHVARRAGGWPPLVGRWCVVDPAGADVPGAAPSSDWTVGTRGLAGAACRGHPRRRAARARADRLHGDLRAGRAAASPSSTCGGATAEVINVVRLTPVQGGRRDGFRTFSRKTAFPDDSVGRWTVDVTTESGQLIGRLRFRVVP